MSRFQRWFHAGGDAQVRGAVGQVLGAPVAGDGSAAQKGDLVVIEAWALPGGDNAYTFCQRLKAKPGIAVQMVIRDGDPYGRQLARFCMADGCLVLAGGALQGLEVLHGAAPRGRSSVDELLQRFESGMKNEDRNASALARLLQFERDGGLLNRLQDPETGLFDGPYASLKLDEEFKRAMRFQLPLSLVLVDIAHGTALPPAGPERRIVLAEVAAVFLNECRDIDVLARFTETVFLLLLPGTGQSGAVVLAGRMLKALRERRFGSGPGLDPRGGLCTVPATGIVDRRTFLGSAELALRKARETGGEAGLCVSSE